MGKQVLFLWLLCFLLFAEALSWWTAPGLGPCLVEAEHSQQATNDDEKHDCPTFFAGSLLLGQRGFEWIKSSDNDKAVVAGFTIVLAISTIGLWLATIDLYRAGERQIEFLRESSEAQSRDMQASIAAAQKSADTAEKAFTNLERPYIFIYSPSKLQLDPEAIPFDDEPTVLANYQVANYGKTPAIIENVRAGLEANDTGFPEPPIRVDEDQELFRVAIIPPGYSYSLPQNAAYGIDFHVQGALAHVQDLKGKELFLYVIINYRGAFTAGHETSACWRYDEETDSLIQYGHDDYNYVK